MNEEKVKQLQKQLLKYLGSKEKLKQFAEECRTIGLPLREYVDSIEKYPEYFSDIIVYHELGLLEKLTKSLKKLKQEK